MLRSGVALLMGIALTALSSPLALSDHSGIHTITTESLKWRKFPNLPQAIELATVFGDPSKPGPYVFRARMPEGTQLMPHRHPDERRVTVLTGTYLSGVGENYDLGKATEYPVGSFYVTPGNAPHYSFARTDVIVQEEGSGPTGMAYVHDDDDPRDRRDTEKPAGTN